MFNFTALPPLSLYVHIPWCVRKCPYCDFNSHSAPESLPEKSYIDALFRDLEHDLPGIWGRSVHSVFIGGGTPSLFSAEAIDSLLVGLRMRLQLSPFTEITLEANPGTVETGRFAEFRAAGINRLSIGCQSFHDQQLEQLGRIHTGREAILAAETAHHADFDNFNLDLMFGLPGQTLQQAQADIDQAIRLDPTHISHYQLTIEPNTLFHHSPPVLPHDETIWTMQEACEELLGTAGYEHYEVSAHAREGRQSQHNLNYWSFGDYLGIGAGAHAKISSAAEQSITRSWKQRHPQAYLDAAPGEHVSGSQVLSRHDASFEFMLNALRLKQGFDKDLFTAHTGLPIHRIADALQQAELKGLIEQDLSRITPTRQGWHFLNELVELFMEEET